jgi:hypothetical protein
MKSKNDVYGENDKRDMFVSYHLVSHTNKGLLLMKW